MVILITGASHTGKTVLAQALLERYHFPSFSMDHLKMGLIRSGNTALTPMSSREELTDYLWPIVREMIKTAIENKQNLIVEGCYIPLDWDQDFQPDDLAHIRFCCLLMRERYIRNHFSDIQTYANAAEARLDDSWCTVEALLQENRHFEVFARKYPANCIVIDTEYAITIGQILQGVQKTGL